MVTHNGSILICGGIRFNRNLCIKLNSGAWKEHSTLKQERCLASVVATPTDTFAFGGGVSSFSRTTFEYLPKNSTTWRMGYTKIPKNFQMGCAIAGQSGQEIWLMGGYRTEKRILKFNVNDHTFHEMTTQLNEDRYGHKCCFIPNTKQIMITGGIGNHLGKNSTEIYNTEDGSITKASPMNFERYGHGIGVITIKGEDRLAVFGGSDGKKSLDSVEVFNTVTKKWETTHIKLNGGYHNFAFLEVKLADIISKL